MESNLGREVGVDLAKILETAIDKWQKDYFDIVVSKQLTGANEAGRDIATQWYKVYIQAVKNNLLKFTYDINVGVFENMTGYKSGDKKNKKH